MLLKKIKILFLFIMLAVLLGSCSVLQNLDDKAGVILETIEGEKDSENASDDQKEPEEENYDKIDIDIKKITSDQKKKIDKWLEDNNLNRYGDSLNTIYTGGTPLFDEITGEAIDRLEYLIEKHPDLINKAISE